MQVAQPVILGFIDDNGIYIGDIKPRFDDGCRYQDVIISFHKIEHDFFQLMTFHLPVPDGDFSIRHQPLNHARHLDDVIYPVVHKEHLSAP